MSDGTDAAAGALEAASDQRKNIDRAKLLLSEGFIIAAATACAYLLAFRYEKGYAEHFSIPVQLINVSLANLLIFVALALTFLLLSIAYLGPFFEMLGHPSLRYVFLLLLMAGMPVYLYGLFEWRRWVVFIGALLAVFVLLGLVELGLPLLLHRKAGDFQARYEAQAAIDHARPPLNVALRRWLGFDVFFPFMALFAGSFLASIAGNAEAVGQKAFYVTNTAPEMVVLRIYGDTMIAAPFNRASKEVHKSFRLLKVSDGAGPALTLEEVGPLKPVPAPTPAPAKTEPTPSNPPPPAPSPTPAPAESPQAGPAQPPTPAAP